MSNPTGAHAVIRRVMRRQYGSPREVRIVRNGLSPWSLAVQCDWCANTRAYMQRWGIPVGSPLQQYGRWMCHAACAAQAAEEAMLAMDRPALDYRPMARLPIPLQVTVMKAALMEGE